MCAAHMSGHHMVHGGARWALTTILAEIIVTPENFLFVQFDHGVRTANHLGKPDDGRTWDWGANGADIPPPIQYKGGFFIHDETNRTPHIADMDGFKIGIEH